MSSVRIFCLTDHPSEKAKELGYVNVPVVVGRYILAPGEELEVPDDELLRRQLKDLLQCEAVAVGSPPAWYRIKKRKA